MDNLAEYYVIRSVPGDRATKESGIVASFENLDHAAAYLESVKEEDAEGNNDIPKGTIYYYLSKQELEDSE